VGEHINIGLLREERPDVGASRQGDQHMRRKDRRQDLPQQLAQVRAALTRFVNGGIPGHQGRPDESAGHGYGIVPRGQQDGHATGLGDGVVRCQHVAAQAVPPVHRAEFRILLQRGNAGGNACQGFIHRTAGLLGVQFRKAGSGCLERPGGVTQQLAPLPRRRGRPARLGSAGSRHRSGHIFSAGDGKAADGFPGSRVQDCEHVFRIGQLAGDSRLHVAPHWELACGCWAESRPL
jgi:hypothetical protein